MKVRVRMYRQGLGDCFLLTFGEGKAAKHVLIDCGTLGSAAGVKMTEVVNDIRKATNDHLDLLIATHEHKDHLSGFLTEKQAFDEITVDHVWLAWTEDPKDELAQKIEKHRGDLITTAQLAARALAKNISVDPSERKTAAALGHGAREILGFFDDDVFGAKLATTVQEAMTYVTRKAKAGPSFLRPDDDPIAPVWLPGVRVYVLGPPRDPKALAVLGDHGSPELYSLNAGPMGDFMAGLTFFAAGEPLEKYYDKLSAEDREDFERQFPFDSRHRPEARDEVVRQCCGVAYDRPEDSWRRIDLDWLAGGAEFALQLDGQTNNTSLALAIELIDDGRVLLFPADAQVGNWLSWHERVGPDGVREPRSWRIVDSGGSERAVTAADLLRRTVIYKVGHHASHNATVRERGLELMERDDLVALIPVDRSVALHKKWDMPARALYRRLIEKAKGRVLRSDIGWAKDNDPDFKELFTKEEWSEIQSAQAGAEKNAGVVFDKIFVECVL